MRIPAPKVAMQSMAMTMIPQNLRNVMKLFSHDIKNYDFMILILEKAMIRCSILISPENLKKPNDP